MVLLRQHPYAIKNQLNATKAPYYGHFLPFAGSLWHKVDIDIMRIFQYFRSYALETELKEPKVPL